MKKIENLIKLFGLFLILSLTNCKTEEPAELKNISLKNSNKKEAVIGGSPINITLAPYQVAILVDLGFEKTGGGVILNNEWILTAAHVVSPTNANASPNPYNVNRVTVRAGNSNINNATSYSVSEIHIHNQYPVNDGNHQPNDIALIRLSSPLTFNNSQSPILISTSQDPLSINDITTVSGWGRTICNNINSASDILMSANIQITNLSTPSLIHASSTSTSAYSGDSGGPLVKNISGIGNVLVGIVNSGNCNIGRQNYARISYFENWIKSITNGLERPKIEGAESFCTSTTYNISNLPADATVNWNVNPSSMATVSNSHNSTILTATGGGTGKLIATITQGSYSYTITKNIKIGGSINLSEIWKESPTIGSGSFPPMSFVALYDNRCTDAIDAEWTVSPSTANINYNSGFDCPRGNNTGVSIQFFSSGTYTIKARVKNKCGAWTNWASTTITKY